MNTLLLIIVSIFGYFGGDLGDVMKDGHLWKTTQIVAYYQQSSVVYDSLTLFEAKWDSIITSKCGDGFKPATLRDYWNTQFEYMEHIGILYSYAGTNMGVGQAPYQMASTSTDTIIGGWNQYKTFTKRLTIEPRLANLPVNQYTQAGLTKYDSINNISFYHYQQILPMLSVVNIACISDTTYNTNSKVDTIIRINRVLDTIKIYDTIHTKPIIIRDTIKLTITDITLDTIIKHKIDTIKVFSNTHDTIIIRDTLNLVDTVTLRDTINAFKINNSYYFEKLNTSLSTVSSTYNPIQLWTSTDSINYSSNSSTTNTFNDKISLKIETNIEGTVEAYIYDNLGVFVDRAKFKLDNTFTPVKYLTFSGYSNTHQKVSKGVYLVRIIAEYKGRTTNNIYRVGIN